MTKEEVKEFMDEFKKTQFDDLHISDSRMKIGLDLPNLTNRNDHYKYKIKYPLNYHAKKSYKIFCDNGWDFVLYRDGPAIYILHHFSDHLIQGKELENFKTTLLYSFSLYILYTLVTTTKFKKIYSTIIPELFEPFENEDSDLILHIDMFNNQNKIDLNRNLYVSIFN